MIKISQIGVIQTLLEQTEPLSATEISMKCKGISRQGVFNALRRMRRYKEVSYAEREYRFGKLIVYWLDEEQKKEWKKENGING